MRHCFARPCVARTAGRRLDSILVAALALGVWAWASSSLPAAVMASHRSVLRDAPMATRANDPAGLLTVADDLGTRLDVAVPAGTARLVIQPCSDSPDGEFGWVSAYDAQGKELLRQRETIGIVFRLEERGVLVGLLGERSDAPVELRVPHGAVRFRVESQNYDKDSNPRKDGRILAFDATGVVVADESGLALDVLTP